MIFHICKHAEFFLQVSFKRVDHPLSSSISCKLIQKYMQKERAETVLSFHIQNGNFCFYFVDLHNLFLRTIRPSFCSSISQVTNAVHTLQSVQHPSYLIVSAAALAVSA